MAAQDEGAVNFSMAPQEDVYSYLMFMVPIERARGKKDGKGMHYGICLAYLIVFVSLTLQLVMLDKIYRSIVLGDLEWQLSVYKKFPDDGCNPGGSLCMRKGNEFTCAPPSVQLAGRWDELDTDGDGVWTRAEVEAAKEDMQCKYKVNPVEVFDVFTNMVLQREDVLWIHPDVRAGTAIPKAYFTFAKSDVIMCNYRTVDMCPNLIMRGFFDQPLLNRNSPRVGNTSESALKYCYELLKPGGACEQLLPSAYSVWKKSSQDQCWGASYDPVTFTNPRNKRTKSMLAVDYDVISMFKRADEEVSFAVYKACVIGIYMLAMFFDLKAIIRFFTFIMNFPKAKDSEDVREILSEDDPEAKPKYTLAGITGRDRGVLVIVALIRLFMCMSLTWIGLSFLLKTMSVLDLILNGLGLLFIVEICNIVYTQMLSPQLAEDFTATEPVDVPMLGNQVLNREPALKEILWFCLLLVILIVVMIFYKYAVTDPATGALKCACLSEGGQCREAQSFNKDFWSSYWSEDLPQVFTSVAEMKAKASTVSVLDSDNPTVVLLEDGRSSAPKSLASGQEPLQPSDDSVVSKMMAPGQEPSQLAADSAAEEQPSAEDTPGAEEVAIADYPASTQGLANPAALASAEDEKSLDAVDASPDEESMLQVAWAAKPEGAPEAETVANAAVAPSMPGTRNRNLLSGKFRATDMDGGDRHLGA